MINAKVRVNQAISHPCHGAPIDLQVRIDDFGWKCLRCLPDNLEASSKRWLSVALPKYSSRESPCDADSR